ncbi:MAG: Asp-tRNA(Asn)/Glu-tRNA(Gln) amidotransferase subunit GatA [Cytophagales bacterium]|nr:Asp-tRNA(Asn)/Glu-tRNA(Gln) amidotransferase subunit GatA [Cytophagales bacterium]
MAYSSLTEVQTLISQKKLTCESLVSYYIANIKSHADLNAFVEVYENEAIARAKEIDSKIIQGKAGKLAGLVVGIKDVISYQGHGLQACSKILDKFITLYHATAVERLLDEDAIIIGRQNCDEFAMGSSNENSAFGAVKNATDPARVPGGSSGGSAVAVQADMCMISLGSDTGGSVRQPASFCGIIGLKPTYSRISRWGLIAYASSFDCIGIFGKNVTDVSIVLETIAGNDDKDSTVSAKPVPQYSQNIKTSKKYKIAYLEEALQSKGVDSSIKQIFEQKIKSFASQGHTISAVQMPLLQYALPAYYILTTAEASSNLSRYDGVKYGHRTTTATDLMDMYKKTRSEGFGKEVQKRIMLGTFVLSASYYDAYYTKAQKVRRLIKNAFNEIFAKHDFIVMPTSPISPWKLGNFEGDALSMYLADIFTVSANIAGIPGISIPAGTDAVNMPVGLQILANDFEEQEILNFSYSLLN